MLLAMLDSLRSGLNRSALADARRHLGGRAGHLRGPVPSGLLEREIHVVDDELFLAVDLQQALPDQLQVDRSAGERWPMPMQDSVRNSRSAVSSLICRPAPALSFMRQHPSEWPLSHWLGSPKRNSIALDCSRCAARAKKQEAGAAFQLGLRLPALAFARALETQLFASRQLGRPEAAIKV